jgi:hypothetical protein
MEARRRENAGRRGFRFFHLGVRLKVPSWLQSVARRRRPITERCRDRSREGVEIWRSANGGGGVVVALYVGTCAPPRSPWTIRTRRLNALAELHEIGRKRWPEASLAQQFTRAIEDPKNRALAGRAHRRPSPPTYAR